jgi:hypothetical protein
MRKFLWALFTECTNELHRIPEQNLQTEQANGCIIEHAAENSLQLFMIGVFSWNVPPSKVHGVIPADRNINTQRSKDLISYNYKRLSETPWRLVKNMQVIFIPVKFRNVVL